MRFRKQGRAVLQVINIRLTAGRQKKDITIHSRRRCGELVCCCVIREVYLSVNVLCESDAVDPVNTTNKGFWNNND